MKEYSIKKGGIPSTLGVEARLGLRRLKIDTGHPTLPPMYRFQDTFFRKFMC